MADKVLLIDVFARRIVGWRVSRRATAGFVLYALEQAIYQRIPAQGQRVKHSDRGSQYLSIKYTDGWPRRRSPRLSERWGFHQVIPAHLRPIGTGAKCQVFRVRNTRAAGCLLCFLNTAFDQGRWRRRLGA